MPGSVLDPGGRASSSSSCRGGCRGRARPSAASPSRSRRCSGSGSSRARERSGYVAAKSRELVVVEAVERAGVQFGAVRVDVERDLEPCGFVGRGLRVDELGAGIDVRGAADAVPVRDVAVRGSGALRTVELAARAARRRVVVAGHDDDRLLATREVPELRQRLLVAIHLLDQVGEEPLLLVGLRDLDLVEVDPIGLDVTGLGAEEQVVGAEDRAADWPSRSSPAQAGLPCRV